MRVLAASLFRNAVLAGCLPMAGFAQAPPGANGLGSAPPPAAAASPKSPGPADVAELALEQHLYFALELLLQQPTAAQGMRPEQREYFEGVLAFHEARFEDAHKALVTALNTHETTLTSEQKIQAFQTLGSTARMTGEFGGCAQMYEDIDKIWGAKLGDGERDIKQNRHLCVAQMGTPALTIEFGAPFTLQRHGAEYPVRVGNVDGGAQLDTGAGQTVLTETTAKAWGVVPTDATVTVHGYSGGEFQGHPGVIPELTIGTAKLHNVAVLVTPDENFYIAPLKLQIHALLGFPVLRALGRLTFGKDGSLSVAPPPASPPAPTGARLWLGDSLLLVQAGTEPGTEGFHFGGGREPRLFVLDTGSGSSYFTDHYAREHPGSFPGPPTETARLAGGGGEVDLPAYGAHRVPLWFGDPVLFVSGPHVLTGPMGNEIEHYEGLIGQDLLSGMTSYTIDLRAMRFSMQP